jgi:kinesin family protein 15
VILEQEELSILKRQNVSRSLSFGLTSVKDTAEEQENACTTNIHNMDEQWIDDLLGYESKGIVRLSTKQVYFFYARLKSPRLCLAMAKKCLILFI